MFFENMVAIVYQNLGDHFGKKKSGQFTVISGSYEEILTTNRRPENNCCERSRRARYSSIIL